MPFSVKMTNLTTNVPANNMVYSDNEECINIWYYMIGERYHVCSEILISQGVEDNSNTVLKRELERTST